MCGSEDKMVESARMDIQGKSAGSGHQVCLLPIALWWVVIVQEAMEVTGFPGDLARMDCLERGEGMEEYLISMFLARRSYPKSALRLSRVTAAKVAGVAMVGPVAPVARAEADRRFAAEASMESQARRALLD
jgi:hypothetical protein